MKRRQPSETGKKGSVLPRALAAGFFTLTAIVCSAADAGGRVLAASDVVSIRIVDHPELDTTARVETDGTINFPYVGRVKAAGRSEDELARAIERGLVERKIIADP